MTRSQRPQNIEQALHLGIEHFQAGRLAEAEAVILPILEYDSTNPIALTLMGYITQKNGDHQKALEFFTKAIKHNTDDPHLQYSLGLTLVELGKPAEALKHFHKATLLKPDYAEAHNSLGVILQQFGKLKEAVACYRQAITLNNHYTEAYNNLGVALKDLGKLDEAEACCRQALTLNPRYAEAHNNLGTVLQQLGNADEAMTCYRNALQFKADYVEAHNNIGNLFQEWNRLDDAISCYRQALAIDPHYANAHNNLGMVMQKRGNIDEALHHYRQASQLNPNDAKAQWNLSLLLLMQGNYQEGFALYERRFEALESREAAKARATLDKLAAVPRWQGEDLQGKTLLVWAEQGLGDRLMMLRYIPLLKDKGAGDILVACQPTLTRIVQSLPGVSRVFDNGMLPLGDCDFHCPLMSLPHLFGTQLDSIPNTVPYIHVTADMNEQWVQRLAPFSGLKVGLVWAGGKALKTDALRSIPFQTLAPLLAVPGIHFVSLQKDISENHDALLDWMTDCHDFLDTAALVQQLDLVISVDTAVAHLTGALGKPVWLLNRYESEWRWMLDREDSPWYPTMRIFRQPALHDWDSVIQRVAQELASLPHT